MNRYALKTIVISLLNMLLLFGCAMQQDVVTLDDRLAAIEQQNSATKQKALQLESRIDELIASQEKKEQGNREQFAEQNALNNALREEIRMLSGRLDEANYLLKQKLGASENANDQRTQQLNRIEQNAILNKDRIVRLEQYLNLEPTEGAVNQKEDSGQPSGTQPEKDLSEDDLYKQAKQAFDRRNFEVAREGFQKLLKRYPSSTQADNAQFWIGEIYYLEKWYEKAILEYQKVIEKYPKGNKVPASLLKQGLAFFNLGDKANARLVLTELVKKYPQSNEAKIAQHKLMGIKP